jgi:V8-like Glu-specific endopeptidase
MIRSRISFGVRTAALISAGALVACSDARDAGNERVVDDAASGTLQQEQAATRPPSDSDGIEPLSLSCGDIEILGDTFPETYYLEEMNSLLNRDELLRRAYGGEAVRSCDDARRFTLAYEPEAERLTGPTEVPAALDPSSLPVEKVDKVLNGTQALLAPVVRWSYNANANSGCSGVIIGPQQILTSAHCVPSVGWQEVSIRQQSVKGAQPEFMFPTAVWINWVRHPSYVGGNLATYDLAVGTLWIEQFPSASRMRVWLDTASKGQDIYYWGYGQTSPAFLPPGYLTQGAGTLRTVSTYWFDSVPSTNPSRTTCSGDSGGAQARYFSWEMLFGLTSRGDCSTFSAATRLRSHMPWIESTLGISCTRYSYNGQLYARCW